MDRDRRKRREGLFDNLQRHRRATTPTVTNVFDLDPVSYLMTIKEVQKFIDILDRLPLEAYDHVTQDDIAERALVDAPESGAFGG